MRLRQLQPEAVLVDLSTDLDAALALVRHVAATSPATVVIGLHEVNDSSVVLASLRAGAKDFLCCPFDPIIQAEAAARVRRLTHPEDKSFNHGRVVAFSSVKPGSGTTTIAMQSAFALRRATSGRVLLVDFDVIAGSVAFTLKLNPSYTLRDVLARVESIDPVTWSTLITSVHDVDILAAPDISAGELGGVSKLREVLELGRTLYDWIVVDLPVIFHRISLSLLTDADQFLLVSTPDLASLHMGRRALAILKDLGIERDRYSLLVNRHAKKENVALADMEKIFGCPVLISLPDDQLSLNKAIGRAEAVPGTSPLGAGLGRLTARLVRAAAESESIETAADTKVALSSG